MSFIVYKTTNTINGKFYIGVHGQSDSPYDFDGYFGSGSLLKKSIKKYGKEFFVRETLFVFETKAEAFNREQSLLRIVLSDDLCYNIDPGGVGNVQFNLNNKSPEYLLEMRRATATRMGLSNKGRKHSPETNKKKSQPGNKHKLGKKESEETRLKKSLAKLGKPSNAIGNYQPICSCIFCHKQMTSSTIKRHVDFHHAIPKG